MQHIYPSHIFGDSLCKQRPISNILYRFAFSMRERGDSMRAGDSGSQRVDPLATSLDLCSDVHRQSGACSFIRR